MGAISHCADSAVHGRIDPDESSIQERVKAGVNAIEKADWQRNSAANQGRRTSYGHLTPSAGEVSCRVRLWEVSRPVSWLYP
jgi:hypothetical protein